jgi:hypothetical protein
MSGSLAEADAAEAAKTLGNLLNQVDHANTTVRLLQRALEAQLGRHVPRQWIRDEVDRAGRERQVAATLCRQGGERPRRRRIAEGSLPCEERCASSIISRSLSEKEERAAVSRLHRLYTQHEKLRQRHGEGAFISRSVLHALHDSLSALPRRRGTLRKTCRELLRRYGSIAASLPAPLEASVRHALESTPSWFVVIPPKAEGKQPRFAAAELELT